MAGRTHDAVTHCKARSALPEALDFAHAFEAEDRARAADRAMLMAGEHKKIGTVERCGLNAHANFVGAGRRGFDSADPGPILVGNNDGSHCVSHGQAILFVIVVPVGAAASSGKHQSQASRWPTLCVDDKHYRDQPGLHGTIGAVFANFRAAHQ